MLQEYFLRPDGVWFPDLEEVLDDARNRFANYPKQPFLSIVDMTDYFRGALSRGQFVSQFLTREVPQKTLKKDLALHQRARELCEAHRSGELGAAEFDRQLLVALRGRPEEDVFAPAPEAWEEAKALICRLARKRNCLPVDFDSVGWRAFLLGSITRHQFAELICAANIAERLAQGPAYGNDKALFAQTYAREIAACQKLHALCAEYRDGKCAAADFDARFLKLAEEFCAEA